MVFIVALYTPWCRYLESLAGISPQPYADNHYDNVVPSGKLGNIKLLLISASGKGFGAVSGLIFMALINYLSLPIFGNETKCCFVPFFRVESGKASCLVKLRKKTFLVGSVVHLIMMVTFFGIAPSLPLLSFATSLSLFLF